MPNSIQHIDLGSATERADGVLFTILELVAEGTKAQIGEEKAKQLAFDVVNTVRGTFGGELVYVCKGRSIDAILRSSNIWSEFRGNNHVELSKKYGCSVQWIYTVIRTMSKIKQAEVQGDLFGGDD